MFRELEGIDTKRYSDIPQAMSIDISRFQISNDSSNAMINHFALIQ